MAILRATDSYDSFVHLFENVPYRFEVAKMKGLKSSDIQSAVSQSQSLLCEVEVGAFYDLCCKENSRAWELMVPSTRKAF